MLKSLFGYWVVQLKWLVSQEAAGSAFLKRLSLANTQGRAQIQIPCYSERQMPYDQAKPDPPP